ncbi:dbb7f978-f873-4c6f-9281-4b015e99a38f [Thermothielavioides terrestris]|uniref:Protein SQS1 n=1 Tax=Thermothielavioides terrestris TaxID=2587410 RepID=A0A3S4BPM8_9PEZI|nr:dbb7f978-f873-4c6f-9281-4b015e99a38f [Thermothielavioides terrestris]
MEDSDEDAILADYIANMTTNSDDDPLASHLRSLSGYRDLGGDDEAVNFGFDDGKSPGRNDSSDDERSSAPGYDIGNSEMDDSEMDDSVNGDDDQEMDAAVDDETLARLLAKQEELGLGGDDLLLFTSSFAQRETTKSPLQAAWQRDRERKKIRKLEREALRAGGLLGKNMDSNDLRVKYPSGMKLDDIKAELTSFLLGSVERLDFPPLDKHARMVLHEIANKLNIKSKSTGQGNQRRPVLYRTNRTFKYASTRIEDAASHVDKAATRVHRKYFHRVDVKVQRTESPRSAGGRTSHKALTLREGEVVGASVPELGQDNKGRAMLEKMGWSKGMALGALDNKGILEPVAQVMKRSKAGLG